MVFKRTLGKEKAEGINMWKFIFGVAVGLWIINFGLSYLKHDCERLLPVEEQCEISFRPIVNKEN